MHALAQNTDRVTESLDARALFRLVPVFEAALQAYQIRAAQCGQSFKHMVLLEAAVLGWHVPALLRRTFSPNTAKICGSRARPAHMLPQRTVYETAPLKSSKLCSAQIDAIPIKRLMQ